MGIREKLNISNSVKEAFDRFGLTDYESFLSFEGGQLVSEVRDRIVHYRPASEDAPAFYLKVYRNPGANSPFVQLLGFRTPATLAELEARNLEWLENQGFIAPKVLAWGSRTKGFSEVDSFLVTEDLIGYAPFDEWLASGKKDMYPEEFRKAKIDRLERCACLLRTLQEKGFHHPYPYLRHFFVSDETPKAGIIDVDSAKISKTVSRRDRSRGLAELFLSSFKSPLSQTDRMRFYRAYCGGRVDRDLATKVLKRFRQKLHRHPNRYAWVKDAISRIPFPNALKDSIPD